jgi:hypothetical protein
MPHPEPQEDTRNPPIKRALDKSKDVKQAVETAADELAIVHAVLDKEIAEEDRTHEVDRAIAQTDRIEKRLSRSVEALEKVADTLAGELQKKSPSA